MGLLPFCNRVQWESELERLSYGMCERVTWLTQMRLHSSLTFILTSAQSILSYNLKSLRDQVISVLNAWVKVQMPTNLHETNRRAAVQIVPRLMFWLWAPAASSGTSTPSSFTFILLQVPSTRDPSLHDQIPLLIMADDLEVWQYCASEYLIGLCHTSYICIYRRPRSQIGLQP